MESLIIAILFAILTIVVGAFIVIHIKAKIVRCSEIAAVKVIDAYVINDIRYIRCEWDINKTHFEKVRESESYEIGDTYFLYYNKDKPTENMTKPDMQVQSMCGKILIIVGVVSLIINLLRILVPIYWHLI